jgi:hypothetical protein
MMRGRAPHARLRILPDAERADRGREADGSGQRWANARVEVIGAWQFALDWPAMETGIAQPFGDQCGVGVINAEPCPRELGREIPAPRRRVVLAACVLILDGVHRQLGPHGRAAEPARCLWR